MGKKHIIRVHKETNYSSISNVPINDENLSPGALGVLVYLLSKPDDWTIYNADLRNRFGIGYKKLDRILGELKQAGYLKRTRYHDGEKFQWDSTVYEQPQEQYRQKGGIVQGAIPPKGMHTLGGHILNTDLTNKQELGNSFNFSTLEQFPKSTIEAIPENVTNNTLRILADADITTPEAIRREIIWRREDVILEREKEIDDPDQYGELQGIFDLIGQGRTGPPAKVLAYLKDKHFYRSKAIAIAEFFYQAGRISLEDINREIEWHDADLIESGKSDPKERARLMCHRILEQGQLRPADESNNGRTWYTEEEFKTLLVH